MFNTNLATVHAVGFTAVGEPGGLSDPLNTKYYVFVNTRHMVRLQKYTRFPELFNEFMLSYERISVASNNANHAYSCLFMFPSASDEQK